MEDCAQRIRLESELISIDRLLLLPDTDQEQLAARRAELFAAITREEFLLSSCGGGKQPRNPHPRARVVRRLPYCYCIPQAEHGLLRRLQGRVRYAREVEGMQHDLKYLEEERLEAMACGDMRELAELDAAAPYFHGRLEGAQGMVDFVTREVDALRRIAADQRREWGAPY